MGKSANVFFSSLLRGSRESLTGGVLILIAFQPLAEAGVRVNGVKPAEETRPGAITYQRGPIPDRLGLPLFLSVKGTDCYSEREWRSGQTKQCSQSVELIDRQDLTEVQNHVRSVEGATSHQEQRITALQGELRALRDDQLKAIAALRGQGVGTDGMASIREQIREMVREELAEQVR